MRENERDAQRSLQVLHVAAAAHALLACVACGYERIRSLARTQGIAHSTAKKLKYATPES